MNEKTYREQQEKFNTQKLEAAIKDLDSWKKLLEGWGEVRPADPTFLRRNSCRLIGDNCESYDHGKCIFYSCNDKNSNYKKWRKHHESAHPEDNLRYNICCKKCKTILKEEIRFMEDRIAKFKRSHEGLVE